MPEIRIHDFPDRPFEKDGVGEVPPTPIPISREKLKQEDELEDGIELNPEADDTVFIDDVSGDPKQPGDLYDEVLNKMARISKDLEEPILFNGVPCKLVGSTLEGIERESFNPMMARMISFYEITKNGIMPISRIPDHLVSACFNHPEFGSVFPTVRRVTSAPLFMEDGSILNGAGYVPELEIYQLPGITFHPFDKLKDAVEVLKEPFKDFEFKDEASEANAWAYFFTMLMYPFIEGNVPFFNFTGTTPGTGKGMLCRTLHRIVEGHDPMMLGWEDKNNLSAEQNLKRTVVSAILKGAPVYFFDNVTAGTQISSNLLAAIATQRQVDVRVLYKTAEKSVPVNSIFTFTGNNISVSDDLKRRTQHIILNTDNPQPETRKFDIDLEEFVLEHREKLLSAALSILKFWHDNKRPLSHQIKGSFQKWTAMIGGIVEFAGFGKFQSKEDSSMNLDPWKDFIEQVYNAHKSEPWKVGNVLGIAFGDEDYAGVLLEVVPDTINKVNIWLGKELTAYKDRPYTILDYETNQELVVKILKTKTVQSNYYISVDSINDIVEEIPF